MLKRILKIALGLIAVAVLLVAGAIIVTLVNFAGRTYPERLRALNEDPMAHYDPTTAVLRDRRAQDAEKTWKGYFSARVSQKFVIKPDVPPDAALNEAWFAARTAGWGRCANPSAVSDGRDFCKPAMRLSIKIPGLGPETHELWVELYE